MEINFITKQKHKILMIYLSTWEHGYCVAIDFSSKSLPHFKNRMRAS